jgi:CRP-like cAMP-binding protein
MSDTVIDQSIARFRKGSSLALNGAGLLPLSWTDEDWVCLFQFTHALQVPAGEPLIRRSEVGRTLFFIMHGALEVFVHSADGIGMGSVSKEGAGTIFGELAFFDGAGRSASVWAVDACDVASMTLEQYSALEQAHPRIARDLLFGLGRLMATRLRRTTAKVAR